MTEAALQAYLPTVATLTVLGIGLLFNNSRIGDVNNRIGDLNSNLNERIDDLRSDNNRQFAELREQYSRMESVIVGKITELEARLDRM